jgi:hypothetical protein
MKRPWRFALLIFILAFVLRLAVAWKTGLFQVMKRTEEEHVALSVARTGRYGNPYSLYTGPTAHEMPIYTYYLAALFALFGTGTLTEAVRITITCALSALRCGCLPLLALDAELGSVTATVAGVLSIFYIPALQTETKGNTDGAWAALVLLAVVWLSLRIWRSTSWQSRTPWRLFALCGFAALLDPAVLPVVLVFVVAGAIACPRGSLKRYLQQATLLLLTVFMCLLPWAIRNRVVLHKWIWTKSNFGLEFWVSNGPGRTYDLATNMGDPDLHPSNSYAEAEKVAALGEAKYNQQKLSIALHWVRAYPGEFLYLTWQRFIAWWFPPGPDIVIQVAKLCISLLAFAGLIILLRRRLVLAWLFLLTWVTFPDIYYVLQWSTRYRFPMDWELLMGASVALAAAYGVVRGGSKRTA